LPEQFAERFGARLLFASTDLVFDGRSAPYAENAPPSPLSVYGASKAQGEDRVRVHGGRVVRLPLLFGADPLGRGATASVRAAIAEARPFGLFTNEYRTPLHAADAAGALVEAVVDPDGPNVFHLPGPERVSRWQLAQRLCAVQGLSTEALDSVECQDPLRPSNTRSVDANSSRAPNRSANCSGNQVLARAAAPGSRVHSPMRDIAARWTTRSGCRPSTTAATMPGASRSTAASPPEREVVRATWPAACTAATV
jgi:dTDP-4-dehydrorhamnose reductase